MGTADLLDRLVYTFGQTDRILGLSGGTARRWIDGYLRGGRPYPPVIRPERTGGELVTWGEFAEARLLSEFRGAGVPLVRLRPAVERLRAEFGRYPLAHARPLLDTDGRELVRRVQDDVALAPSLQLVVARSGQLLLSGEAESFTKSADYDDGAVARLRPDPREPDVMVDPLRSCGDPVVRAVPTEVIAEQVRAGDPPALVAEIYELALGQVHAAVRFEQLRAA
jgi:uncharacterized protein (DUF433 family)